MFLHLLQEVFVIGGEGATLGDNDDRDHHRQWQERLATIKRSWAGQVSLESSACSSAVGEGDGERCGKDVGADGCSHLISFMHTFCCPLLILIVKYDC